MIDPVKMSSMFTGTQPVQQAVQQAPVDEPQQFAQPTGPAQPTMPPATPSASSVTDDLQQLNNIVADGAQTVSLPQQQEPQQEEQVPLEVPSEGVVPHAVMQAATAAPVSNTLNPPNPAPATAKETFERPIAPDAVVDANAAVQHVETEASPEIPVEVEGFLQRVEEHKDKLPQEVVIADGTNEQANTNYPARPVIVLPITQEQEKEGKSKSPRFSLRWLVEWSHKIIKMFAGKVVYKQEEG